uniref:Uncharacterized protein n=1 Tax=Solanum tuberosum TaxID=4113 RepID=M1BC76_SOLTU
MAIGDTADSTEIGIEIGNGGKAVANANCAADLNIGKGLTTSTTGEEMFNVNLTKEEYGHLQAALQHFQKDYDVECSTTNQAFANGTIDFADWKCSIRTHD